MPNRRLRSMGRITCFEHRGHHSSLRIASSPGHRKQTMATMRIRHGDVTCRRRELRIQARQRTWIHDIAERGEIVHCSFRPRRTDVRFTGVDGCADGDGPVMRYRPHDPPRQAGFARRVSRQPRVVFAAGALDGRGAQLAVGRAGQTPKARLERARPGPSGRGNPASPALGSAVPSPSMLSRY